MRLSRPSSATFSHLRRRSRRLLAAVVGAARGIAYSLLLPGALLAGLLLLLGATMLLLRLFG